MKKAWILEPGPAADQEQTHLSFIGGKPRIPANTDIPFCELCGAIQVFFFQVAFPIKHPWAGKTLAVFQCVSCSRKDYFIPKMLEVPLRGADIPESFLDDYQANFRFLVFNTEDGIVAEHYAERVAFRPWRLVESWSASWARSKVGGNPLWIFKDESPATFNRTTKMCFLMQLAGGLEFAVRAGAPRQITTDLEWKEVPSPNTFYELFLQNNLYFFGSVLGSTKPKVYCVTQVG